MCVCVCTLVNANVSDVLSQQSLSLSDASFRNDTISTLALLTFVLGDHQQRLMEHTMFTLVMEICSLHCRFFAVSGH